MRRTAGNDVCFCGVVPISSCLASATIVLGSSIRSFDSTRDLVALVTAAVPSEWHSALEVAGWTVKPVEEVEEFWWGKSAECSNFDADQNERWGHMATKLRLWQMTQYERVLYLDADTILTADASETFLSIILEKRPYGVHSSLSHISGVSRWPSDGLTNAAPISESSPGGGACIRSSSLHGSYLVGLA